MLMCSLILDYSNNTFSQQNAFIIAIVSTVLGAKISISSLNIPSFGKKNLEMD